MIPCGACGSYVLPRSSQRHQSNSLNLRQDTMASSKVIYAVLVCGVLTVTAVIALSVLVGVYGKQIMDFIRKHEPEWYKENTTKTNNATNMAGDRGGSDTSQNEINTARKPVKKLDATKVVKNAQKVSINDALSPESP